MPPQAFRKRGQQRMINNKKISTINRKLHNVSVVTCPAINVITLDHQGDYSKLPATFDKLYYYMNLQKIFNNQTRVFSLYYHDPLIVETTQLKSKACFSIPSSFRNHTEYKQMVIPPGQFAMLAYQGPYNDLPHIHAWFSTWLIDSDHQPRNYPVIEEYKNNPHDVKPSELLTHIYIAIQ